MIHIFSGSDTERLKISAMREIKSKIKEPINDFNFETFDMFNDLIQDAISSAETMSFTTDVKFVVIFNCYFLTGDRIKVQANWNKKQDLQSLSDYVKQENPDCELYLLVPGKLISERSSKLIKSLKSKSKIVSLADLKTQDLMEIGMRYVGENKANIDRESLFEVINRTGGDYASLIHTLDKLMLYTDRIDMPAVTALVKNKLEDNVFSIVENLFKSHLKLALKGYRDLSSSGYSAMSLLPVFASQLRFIYKVTYLLKKGENDITISKELKCNPYRVKITRSISSKYALDSILNIMSDLGEIEDHVKFDGDNPDVALEVFMVNFRKKYLLKIIK